MPEIEKRYEIRVRGRVQGVGFRYAARNQARLLGLKGWVEKIELSEKEPALLSHFRMK